MAVSSLNGCKFIDMDVNPLNPKIYRFWNKFGKRILVNMDYGLDMDWGF